MTHPARPALGREDGFSMYIVVMAMMVLLTLGAALSVAGHQSSTAISDDELGVRALQAAEAGAQAAVHRMNLQQPADDQVHHDGRHRARRAATPGARRPSAESVGNNASYRYQTSIPMTQPAAPAASYRVLSAPALRRVHRNRRRRHASASSSASSPRPARTRSRWPASSARTSSRRRTTTASPAASGPTASSSSTTTARSAARSSSGRARRTRSATRDAVTRNPTPFVLSPPNMLNPTTLLDSKTSNDNGRLLAGASPVGQLLDAAAAPVTRPRRRDAHARQQRQRHARRRRLQLLPDQPRQQQLDQHRDRREDPDLHRLAGPQPARAARPAPAASRRATARRSRTRRRTRPRCRS